MNTNKTKRILLSFVTSLCHGLLLAWVLTFERGSLDQLLATSSIIALLMFSHYATSRILDRSIFIIHSYGEGILFFLNTIIAFRIGDQYLGITKLSLRTEIFLILLGVISGTAYVWSMRRAYSTQRKNQ
jgi:hypothetical protein